MLRRLFVCLFCQGKGLEGDKSHDLVKDKRNGEKTRSRKFDCEIIVMVQNLREKDELWQ